MKDMFEEQLKAKLEELESDPEVAGMLSSGAIWDKISRAQNPLPQKRLWLPRMAKIAAALVICSGIALLLRPRQESTGLLTQAVDQAGTGKPLKDKPVLEQAPDIPATAGLPPALRKEQAATGRKEAPSPAGKVQPVPAHRDVAERVPDSIYVSVVPEIQVPPEVSAPARQTTIVYLSDLEKETPAAPAPRKALASSKTLRYIVSNQGAYTCIPPMVFLNQILK